MSIHTLELLSPDSWTSIVAFISYCFAVHLWGNPFFLTSAATFCAADDQVICLFTCAVKTVDLFQGFSCICLQILLQEFSSCTNLALVNKKKTKL